MDVVQRINNRMSEFTPAQKKVADYIVKNVVKSAFSTVDSIAHESGTSTMTVVRLAYELGYTGYSDFQNALQMVVISNESPSIKLDAWSSYRKGESTFNDIIRAHEKSISETLRQLSEESVSNAAELIISARRIYVSGGRSSYGVAHYLMHNLNRITGRSRFLDAQDCELPETIASMSEKDVLIVINMPRYLTNTLSLTKLVREQGTKIIAITDSYISPYQNICDILLLADFKGVSFFNSMVSSQIIAEILIGIVADIISEDAEKHMDGAEKIAAKMGVHPKIR